MSNVHVQADGATAHGGSECLVAIGYMT